MRDQSVPDEPSSGVRSEIVTEIFSAATILPARERHAFVSSRCNGDRALLAEVESLLAFHDPKSAFLERSALRDAGLSRAGAERDDGDEHLSPGTKVARYTIQRIIGAGGMGVVYEAEQESPRRRVALKVMRPGFVSGVATKRFVQEAAALALLQHPGIAQIFDFGRDEAGGAATPFLAMELVSGVSLTAFLKQKHPATRDKLALFLRVCEAVTHAHSRGVIHRDLKPANVLVTEEGQAKILDFGIARLVQHDAHATMATSSGQVLGTLAYMSPEQASGDPDTIDIRADVYSLGAMLYEILAGKLPIDVSRCTVPEAMRRVATILPPRLGTLRRELRGDLDTIAARAIEKDKARRYQSAADFAEDIRRFLAGEPIRAKQDSALYVLGKTVRRHRGPVAALFAALFGLTAFGVYASIKSRSEHDARLAADQARTVADRARALSETERARADDAARRLDAELSIANIERGRLLASSGNYIAAEETLWREHLKNPDSAHSYWSLWELYSHSPCALALTGHDAQGRAFGLHPAGRFLATAGHAGSFFVWDLDTGKRLSATPTPGKLVLSVACSADGLRILTTDDAGFACVWDFTDPGAPRELLRVGAAPKGIRHGEFSPDRLTFLTVADTSVSVWNSETGHAVGCFALPEPVSGRMYAARFSIDGKKIAVASPTSDVFMVDAPAPDAPHAESRLLVPAVVSPWPVVALGFTRDGRWLLTGGDNRDRSLRIWDLTGHGALLVRMIGWNGSVRQLALSPDERLVAASGYYRTDVWSLESMERVHANIGGVSGGFGTAFTPDGKRLITTSADGAVRIWKLDSAAKSRTVQVYARTYASHLSATRDGKTISLSGGNQLSLVDAATGAITRRRTRDLWSGAISPDGSLRAAGYTTGRVVITSLPANKELASFEAGAANIVAVAFVEAPPTVESSADAGRNLKLAALASNGRVFLFDLATSTLEVLSADRVTAYRLAVSHDGARIAAVRRGEAGLSIWNAADGSLWKRIPIEADERCAAFSPDSGRLAIGTSEGGVEVWDLTTGTRLFEFDAHASTVLDIAYNRAGTLIATSSEDGLVRLWDPADGRPLPTLNEAPPGTTPRPPATCVCFLDDDLLAASFGLGALEIFDLAYFKRLIAGNFEHNLAKVMKQSPGLIDEERAREWARGLAASR